MKSLALLFLSFAVSVALAAPSFDVVFNALTGGEVEREAARVKLLALSQENLARFMTEAKARTQTKNRFQVVRAFDVLRRRADLTSGEAVTMIEILKPGRKIDLLEERLQLILEAKAGLLTPAKVQSELQFSTLTSEPSARRLARLTALTDAMQESGMKPTTVQLESLLQNDVFEIRIHAVDWFRISPPIDLKERSHFLKLALISKPVQVRESAYRTIASWPSGDVKALKKNDVLPEKCGADPSNIIRAACANIREKAKQP